MTTYEIKFNLYPPSGLHLTGHVNVSFVIDGQVQSTFGLNIAPGMHGLGNLIPNNGADGFLGPESTTGAAASQTILVTQGTYENLSSYVSNRAGYTDYSLFTNSCFTFSQDVFNFIKNSEGYLGGPLPGSFFDLFSPAERTDAGGLVQLGVLVLNPMWAAGMLLLAARFGPAAPYALLAGVALDLIIRPQLRQSRDPLVLDLDGDGVEVTSLNGSSVQFDYDQDGFAERTGWVSADDGILVIDGNGNGEVDGAAELFGSPSQDGFEVLETLDTNGDGRIDAQDEEFAKLRIWQDTDGDGVSDAGELVTLEEAGIVAIELTRTAVNGNNNGNGVGFQANFIRDDATTGIAQTIYFETDRQETADPTPGFTPAEGVDKLPQLPRSGQLLNLAYVLSNDAAFRADWTALTDGAAMRSPDELRAEFVDLLLRWAGVDGSNPHGRGQYVDGRHLAFVEKFFGETYSETQRGQEVSTYPGRASTGAAMESSFQQIVGVLETVFLAQVTWSSMSRASDAIGAFTAEVTADPYFAFSMLDLRSEILAGEEPSATPGNLQMVVEFIKMLRPDGLGAQVDYLQKALSGLEGMVTIAFDGSREDYAEFMVPLMADIEDPLIRQIATEFASLTAREGTVASEGLVGDAGDNVLIGGKGDDGVDGKDGNDIYIYRSGDGHEWLNDTGPATDTDTLILTDLDPSDITLNRNGDDLLIVVTATGAIIEVNDFFKLWGTASNGIEQIRFADDTVWDRDDIKANTVFTGSPGNNTITDSAQDDVIHGLGGNDYIKIGAGSDTILYGEGDGSDDDRGHVQQPHRPGQAGADEPHS